MVVRKPSRRRPVIKVVAAPDPALVTRTRATIASRPVKSLHQLKTSVTEGGPLLKVRVTESNQEVTVTRESLREYAAISAHVEQKNGAVGRQFLGYDPPAEPRMPSSPVSIASPVCT
jgi:hypothetical protein